MPRSSSFNTGRIDHLCRDDHERSNLALHFGFMTNCAPLFGFISAIQPGEVYNLAAQSRLAVSPLQEPTHSIEFGGLA